MAHPRAKSISSEAKRVTIWIRVSTEDQVRGESPETHERRARLYAESKGWTVVEVYRLDAVSGKTVRETPEAKRMLADVREGRITGLIFSKLAQLALGDPAIPLRGTALTTFARPREVHWMRPAAPIVPAHDWTVPNLSALQGAKWA